MSHGFHERLPGYHPEQILHDGCEECETRASNPAAAIANLDSGSFTAAWTRAAAWQQHGMSGISSAEAGVLQALWAVQVQLERRGVSIGSIPSGQRDVTARLDDIAVKVAGDLLGPHAGVGTRKGLEVLRAGGSLEEADQVIHEHVMSQPAEEELPANVRPLTDPDSRGGRR